MIRLITVATNQQGLYDITSRVNELVSTSGLQSGLCTLFIQHTSASLIIQESYDPSAKADLESWLNRLVPELDPLYSHTLEGDDDMPAHIKSTLTATSLAVPFMDQRLALGTWQGVYLWEHRHAGGRRNLVVHLGA
ncbi:secondary thiamine-phosphate synthase enzyme YjbQ [Halioxenophilus sp. WMMB6]|uniref:secondary thiamine-phosphate synthase enzyme YjbQ n=1 Tax=Halioxenophilus sp. WMMB6 TaxID=3073815 RepID=UPI00295F51E4|nr:secondary thiamine-phosphate synthase enzyme YjbQ [Halioxenophilus sp. WMMB6]